MKPKCCGLLLMTGLIPVLLAAGCTNSDPLSSGAGSTIINLELTNTQTRFDRVFFNVSQLTVQPLDTQAAEVLGNNLVGLLNASSIGRNGQIEISVGQGQTQFVRISGFTAGRYRLASFVMSNLFLEDTDAPPGTATCEEFVTDYPEVSGPFPITDFGQEVVLTIGETPGETTVVIDVQALIEAFQTSWNCVPLGTQIINPNPPPFVLTCLESWCLTGFNRPAFLSQSQSYLAFP